MISAQVIEMCLPTKIPGRADEIARLMATYGKTAGLDMPHRQAQFLAQVAHESRGTVDNKPAFFVPRAENMRYTSAARIQAVWPTRFTTTAAAVPYVNKPRELANYVYGDRMGNTDYNDGYKHRGIGLIQLTGRQLHAAFYRWCVLNNISAPNFEEYPEKIAEAPWDFLSAIFFWRSKYIRGKTLNYYSDRGDIEMVTRGVNGSLTGFAERCELYTCVALSLLGYDPKNLMSFQLDSGLTPDGVSGPSTRAAMHTALVSRLPGNLVPAGITNAPVSHEVLVEEPRKPLHREPMGQAAGLGILSSLGVSAGHLFEDYRVTAILAITTIIILLIGLMWHRKCYK